MSGQVQWRNAQNVELLSSDFVNCWIPIAGAILLGDVGSVTFASLPQNFRTLVMIMQVRSTANAENDEIAYQANLDGFANYDTMTFQARGDNTLTGTAVFPIAAGILGWCDALNARASNWSPLVCYWYGYALADREKWTMSRSTHMGNVTAVADVSLYWHSSRWRNTNAITRIDLFTGVDFATGSRFDLYGIL